MAGVSRATVSFVLNDLEGVSISAATRQKVLEAARILNYHPDAAGRQLVSGKSNTLGLVLYQTAEQVFADALLPAVILGIEQAAAQVGFRVLLKPVEPGDPGGYTRLIMENHVDGILLSGPRQDDTAILELHAQGVPIMLIGQLPGRDIPFVDIDGIRGAQLAVDHLLQMGHTRIGMITNAPMSYVSAQHRRAGYERALLHNGLQVDSDCILEGSYTPASGYRAMQEVLSLVPRPTAVFIASDVVAAGAMLAARRAGLRLPHDLALVGFDDIPMAEFFDPPLSSVRLPAHGLGWAGAERLIRLIGGEGLDANGIFLDAELVVRDSSRTAELARSDPPDALNNVQDR